MLVGQTLTPELVEAAAQEAQRLATPIDDVRATGEYRKSVVAVLTQRTLENSIEMARGGDLPFAAQRRLAIQTAF
jgi:carbon-monoxide dehydrogenase medium subunit